MRDLGKCPACDLPTAGAKPAGQYSKSSRGTAFQIRLFECACGHAFSNPQPSLEELAPFYEADYHVFADPFPDEAAIAGLIARRSDGGRFNHVKVIPGGRYLDVGCGLGVMVAAMSRLGMRAEGVEPSPIAARKARDAGLEVSCGTLEEAHFDDDSFDCMSMYHVLEHVPDPAALLGECRRVLKPGGELVVGVPNYDSAVCALVGGTWGGLDLPRHLHQFRSSSLRRIAERAGLRVATLETESLVEHVEAELVHWLRRRFFLPARVTKFTGAARPLARRLTRSGNATGRGEAIVVHLVK